MKTELVIVLTDHHKYIIMQKWSKFFGLIGGIEPLSVTMHDKKHKNDVLLQGDSMIDARMLCKAVKSNTPMFATIDGIYGVNECGTPYKLTGIYPTAI